MPEGHTLHALAGRVHHAFAGTTLAASQPAGPVRGGRGAAGRTVHARGLGMGQAPVRRVRRRRLAARPPRPDRQVRSARRRADSVVPREVAVRAQVRLRLLNDTYVGRPARAEPVRRRHPRARWRRCTLALGPDPLRPGADPEMAWRKIHRSRPADRRAADGPGGAGRHRQRLPLRAALPAPGRPLPPRAGDPAAPPGPRSGTTSCDLMPLGRRVRPDHHDGGPGRGRPRSPYDTTGTVRPGAPLPGSTSAPGEPCRVCGSTIRTRLVAGRNLFWCGRCQRRR